MSLPGTVPAATPSLGPSARWRRLASRAVRLALVVAIGLCGWSLARTGRDLFGTPAPRPGPVPAAPADPAPWADGLLPGTWTFDDGSGLVDGRPWAGAGSAAAVAPPLLPLPPGVRPLARRWDAAGRLNGDLIGPVSCTELGARWREDGWEAGPAETAGLPGRAETWRRGGEAVLAVVWGAGGGAADDYVLLVPAGAARPQRKGP